MRAPAPRARARSAPKVARRELSVVSYLLQQCTIVGPRTQSLSLCFTNRLAAPELVTNGPKHSFCRVCNAHGPDSNVRKTVYVVPVGVLDENPKLVIGQHIFVWLQGTLGCDR